jgi:tRNA(His) guanylyltransferase
MADSLGDRMKAYEKCSAVTLLPNAPIIIRVDGKAFHTFTKKMNFKRPFDEDYINCMKFAAIRTGSEMQNFKAAYVQSDEVTFLLHNDNPVAESWFGGKVQKLTSISAVIMSNHFNMMVANIRGDTDLYPARIGHEFEPAIFDSRAFNIIERDIPNIFLWRMKDWRRNSVQMYARSIMSNKQMHGKSNREVLLELQELGYEWTDLDPRLRNGTLIFNHDRKIIEYTDFEPTYFEVNGIFQEYGIVS